MNVKWEDVKEDYARKDSEIEKLKVMNAELVELIGEMNVGYSADIRADELIKRAKDLNHETI